MCYNLLQGYIQALGQVLPSGGSWTVSSVPSVPTQMIVDSVQGPYGPGSSVGSNDDPCVEFLDPGTYGFEYTTPANCGSAESGVLTLTVNETGVTAVDASNFCTYSFDSPSTFGNFK